MGRLFFACWGPRARFFLAADVEQHPSGHAFFQAMVGVIQFHPYLQHVRLRRQFGTDASYTGDTLKIRVVLAAMRMVMSWLESHGYESTAGLQALTGINRLQAEQRIVEPDKAAAGSPVNIFRTVVKAVERGQTQRTSFVGAERGHGFEDTTAVGLLVGFNITFGSWGAGYRFKSITSLQPIYLTANGNVTGKVCGERSGEGQTILAKDGYAVGAVLVQGGNLIEGVRLRFYRLRGRSLNTKDSYDSPYFGGQEKPNPPALGTGKPIVGVVGNCEEHVRRLALVELK
jgi:hypothetical protein